MVASVSRPLLALLLTLFLVVAPVAAQDPGSDPPSGSDPPESDPEPQSSDDSTEPQPSGNSTEPDPSGNSTDPQHSGTVRCRFAQFSSINLGDPTSMWVILDPDGCLRTTVYRLIDWDPRQ